MNLMKMAPTGNGYRLTILVMRTARMELSFIMPSLTIDSAQGTTMEMMVVA